MRGYPLAMVHSEKIVTAIARGTASTRWRDFADMYMLARHHAIDGSQLGRSLRDVATHRNIELAPLERVLAGYGGIGQQRWAAWRRKQRLDVRLPEQFSDVLAVVVAFADPPSPAQQRDSPGTRQLAHGREYRALAQSCLVLGRIGAGQRNSAHKVDDSPKVP